MDALFALEEAPIPDVRSEMIDPPSANAIRTLLQILEDKGHVKRRKEGRNYVFSPKESRKRAGKGALQHVLETFYQGSIEDDSYQRLRALIEDARGKQPNKKNKRQ